MSRSVPVRGTSLTQQTVDILIDRIRSGFYPSKGQIPPEHQLAAEFNVSRATIRSAISILAERGLVVRRQGVGTFVTQRSRVSNPLNEAEDFCYIISNNGFEPGIQFAKVAVVQPEENIADALVLEPGQTVLRSYKIFTADDDPMMYCINSIPTPVLGDTLVQELMVQPEHIEPLFDLLEERCNQRTEYQIANIQVDIMQNCKFPELDIEPTTPVLVIEEVGYNADEIPLWHSFEYFPNNCIKFEVLRHRVRK